MRDEVVKFINDNKERNISVEDTRKSLIASGWKEEDLKPYFSENTSQTSSNKLTGGLNQKLFGNIPLLSLKLGLAFVFIYAAVFVSGDAKTGAKYVPEFVTNIVPLKVFLPLFSIFEIVLALWILTGKFRRYAGVVTVLFLLTITILNYSFLNVTFRNFAIIGAAFAFATM